MSKDKSLHVQPEQQSHSRTTSWKIIVLTAVISSSAAFLVQSRLTRLVLPGHLEAPRTAGVTRQCRPPLLNLFTQKPIRANQPEVKSVLEMVDTLIRDSFSGNQIDGLALAVVTPNEVLYEAGLGALKANETDPSKRGKIDRHSIFRIASGSKLFAVLETLILREKGALQWDDPITKFISGFKYAEGGWADIGSVPAHPNQAEPITLRQLASHMSGLGREYPRGEMKHWPHSTEGLGPPPINGCPFPSVQETIAGLAKYPLVVPTYSYPVYSNAGLAVLGQASVVANREYESSRGLKDSPDTWPALARRDIFDRLGLNGSSFVVSAENTAHVAVASVDSNEVDMDFLDIMSCSGGQMSSLSDYIKVIQMILDPSRPESLLPPHVVREWLRPLYGWSDETTEVGMLWEIERIADTYARPVRIFQKLGVLGASRSVFAVNQEYNYGIALLMTGSSDVAGDLVLDIFKLIQPVLDRLIAKQTKDVYSGQWIAVDDGTNATEAVEVDVKVEHGSLWITKLVLNGTDVLNMTQGLSRDKSEGKKAMPVAMWSTGRQHEFRIVFRATEKLGKLPYSTCFQSWVSIDQGFARGYPMDLIYFVEMDKAEGGMGGPLMMYIPSVGVRLVRLS